MQVRLAGSGDGLLGAGRLRRCSCAKLVDVRVRTVVKRRFFLRSRPHSIGRFVLPALPGSVKRCGREMQRMLQAMKLTVNGQDRVLEGVDPDMPLLWAIRDLLGLKGTKFGCGMALCGACTVHGGISGSGSFAMVGGMINVRGFGLPRGALS